MFNASSLLLIAVTAFPTGPAEPQARPGQRGGAIIDPTISKEAAAKNRFGLDVRVLDIFDHNQVLLSFGEDQGARKGQEGILLSRDFLLLDFVELTAVGERHSIGRFKQPSFLIMALRNKDNPVRKDGLLWLPGLPLRPVQPPPPLKELDAFRELPEPLFGGAIIIEKSKPGKNPKKVP